MILRFLVFLENGSSMLIEFDEIVLHFVLIKMINNQTSIGAYEENPKMTINPKSSLVEMIYIDPDRPPISTADLKKLQNQNKSKAKK